MNKIKRLTECGKWHNNEHKETRPPRLALPRWGRNEIQSTRSVQTNYH